MKHYLVNNEALRKKVSSNREMHTLLKENVIKKIVTHLTTKLSSPEDVIIKHFDDTTDLFMYNPYLNFNYIIVFQRVKLRS